MSNQTKLRHLLSTMQRFLNDNNLSLKKATLIAKDCKSNPFIVYKFYDRLEQIICENNLGPDDIWKMDETAFCLDLKKSNNFTERIQSL